MNSAPVYKLRLARTLYNNFFRARLQDANGEDAGQLLIVPGLPLDRSQLPENAPEADPYLLVIVEDANINKIPPPGGLRNTVLGSNRRKRNFFKANGVISVTPFALPSVHGSG